MYAAAVELLVEKASFEPRVALAFVEAIEMALKESQLVTVPILDARFAAQDAKIERVRSELEQNIEQVKSELLVRMEQIKAELVRWLFLMVIGNAAITAALSAIQRVH